MPWELNNPVLLGVLAVLLPALLKEWLDWRSERTRRRLSASTLPPAPPGVSDAGWREAMRLAEARLADERADHLEEIARLQRSLEVARDRYDALLQQRETPPERAPGET